MTVKISCFQNNFEASLVVYSHTYKSDMVTHKTFTNITRWLFTDNRTYHLMAENEVDAGAWQSVLLNSKEGERNYALFITHI